MYYIGIDGGGTKSEYTLMDDEFKTISSYMSGATNINSHGYDFVSKSIKEGVDGVLIKSELNVSDIKALCIGSAGVDRESDKLNYENILSKLGFKNFIVVNDSDITLSAGTKGKPGIIVIAGTGSIVYGANGNSNSRVGGWGHLIGDEGSGYHIAEQGIRKAIHFSDGYGEETKLLDALLDKIEGKDAGDFIEFIYTQSFNKDRIAELSQVVDRLANEGDEVAKNILLNQSEKLFYQTDMLISKLFKNEKTVRLVFNGSVIKESKIFRNRFLELLEQKHKNAEVTDLSVSASVGAVYLAKGIGE